MENVSALRYFSPDAPLVEVQIDSSVLFVFMGASIIALLVFLLVLAWKYRHVAISNLRKMEPRKRLAYILLIIYFLVLFGWSSYNFYLVAVKQEYSYWVNPLFSMLLIIGFVLQFIILFSSKGNRAVYLLLIVYFLIFSIFIYYLLYRVIAKQEYDFWHDPSFNLFPLFGFLLVFALYLLSKDVRKDIKKSLDFIADSIYGERIKSK